MLDHKHVYVIICSTVTVVPLLVATTSASQAILVTPGAMSCTHWDRQSYEVPCCNVTGFPWFHRDYGTNTTTDSIVLRLCGDEDGEESPVSFLDSNNNFLPLEV